MCFYFKLDINWKYALKITDFSKMSYFCHINTPSKKPLWEKRKHCKKNLADCLRRVSIPIDGFLVFKHMYISTKQVRNQKHILISHTGNNTDTSQKFIFLLLSLYCWKQINRFYRFFNFTQNFCFVIKLTHLFFVIVVIASLVWNKEKTVIIVYVSLF